MQFLRFLPLKCYNFRIWVDDVFELLFSVWKHLIEVFKNDLTIFQNKPTPVWRQKWRDIKKRRHIETPSLNGPFFTKFGIKLRISKAKKSAKFRDLIIIFNQNIVILRFRGGLTPLHLGWKCIFTIIALKCYNFRVWIDNEFLFSNDSFHTKN